MAVMDKCYLEQIMASNAGRGGKDVCPYCGESANYSTIVARAGDFASGDEYLWRCTPCGECVVFVYRGSDLVRIV